MGTGKKAGSRRWGTSVSELQWQPYDPSWLVRLARQQYPDQPWLAEAFAGCTRCLVESRAYLYFVNPAHPNQPGSEWQFERNLLLDAGKEGKIVVDVVVGPRIGGIEFLKRL